MKRLVKCALRAWRHAGRPAPRRDPEPGQRIVVLDERAATAIAGGGVLAGDRLPSSSVFGDKQAAASVMFGDVFMASAPSPSVAVFGIVWGS